MNDYPAIELEIVRICERHRYLPERAIMSDESKHVLSNLLRKRGYAPPDWSTLRIEFESGRGIVIPHLPRS